MPDMDGITATQHIRQRFIFTQVIILSVQSDPNYMRRAMRAGAHDFLSKPPMMDELTSVIKRAGKLSEEQRSMAEAASGDAIQQSQWGGMIPVLQGKSVCVYSPKGGTGVTTDCRESGRSFARQEQQSLLVDGNNQYGSIPILFSVQSKYTVLDLLTRVEELDPDIISDVMVTHEAIRSLDILPAPPRLENAEEVTAEAFVTLINYLRRYYHYVVVDTCSYLTDIDPFGIGICRYQCVAFFDRNHLTAKFEFLPGALSCIRFDPAKFMFILELF